MAAPPSGVLRARIGGIDAPEEDPSEDRGMIGGSMLRGMLRAMLGTGVTGAVAEPLAAPRCRDAPSSPPVAGACGQGTPVTRCPSVSLGVPRCPSVSELSGQPGPPALLAVPAPSMFNVTGAGGTAAVAAPGGWLRVAGVWGHFHGSKEVPGPCWAPPGPFLGFPRGLHWAHHIDSFSPSNTQTLSEFYFAGKNCCLPQEMLRCRGMGLVGPGFGHSGPSEAPRARLGPLLSPQ